jgi:putative ABC transport system ATP-binding protein
MRNSTEILQMKNVTKRFPATYGDIEILHRVNLKVSQGEFVVITGPSGSGKTTFLHLAALLDCPSSGEVMFDGQDVSIFDEPELCHLRKHKIGMVFQNYYLLPNRSVLENVLFRFRYLDYDRAEAERLGIQALQSLGLMSIAERQARLLSAGEMQRVAIARAVTFEPTLLVADEPTGNLDKASTKAVMDCFRGLNQMGITILMVTHNESLLKYSSRHLVCHDGAIES